MLAAALHTDAHGIQIRQKHMRTIVCTKEKQSSPAVLW